MKKLTHIVGVVGKKALFFAPNKKGGAIIWANDLKK
jgi:hypothetical protein